MPVYASCFGCGKGFTNGTRFTSDEVANAHKLVGTCGGSKDGRHMMRRSLPLRLCVGVFFCFVAILALVANHAKANSSMPKSTNVT